MVVIDLGCFNNKRAGSIGVDKLGPPITQADHICNIGFQPLPFPDCFADEVYASCFLEHIPFFVFDKHGDRMSPMVFTFNEVYRVLKPSGKFLIWQVLVQNPATGTLNNIAFRSPEHVSYWTWETIEMFCDGYYGTRELWGHTSRFKLVHRDHNGEFANIGLEAVK